MRSSSGEGYLKFFGVYVFPLFMEDQIDLATEQKRNDVGYHIPTTIYLERQTFDN